MSRQSWILIGLLSVGTLTPLVIAPANACTPAPDNPHGCDRINQRVPLYLGGGGDGDDPWPPNCIVCGQVKFHPQDGVIQPSFGLQKQFDSDSIRSLNPQPLPPKQTNQNFGF